MRTMTSVILLAGVCTALACDEKQFPKTHSAATKATQAAKETASEVKHEAGPVLHEIAEQGKATFQRGREAAEKTMDEVVKPRLNQAAEGASHLAHQAKIAATQAAHSASVAATQAAEKVKTAATRAAEKIRN